jgi:four helix bundle protein
LENLVTCAEPQGLEQSKTVALKNRTKQFAIRIVKLFRSLPKTDESRVIGKQLLRLGTSVAANYRAVCRARSKNEFIAKIGVVVEEADETVFWLELLVETAILDVSRLGPLMNEANELLAIFAASQRTARGPYK